MTDAAIPITQSVVEQFTEQYLSSLGATIEKRRDRWEVTIPENASTRIPSGQLILFCDDPAAELSGNKRHLHPESPSFQELLAEVSEKKPTGKIAISSDDTHIDIPS